MGGKRVHPVIASEAKQSISPQRKYGLLRRFAPRNDGKHTFTPSRRDAPESLINLSPKEAWGTPDARGARKPEAVERRFFIPTADARKCAGCNSRDTISAPSIASSGRKTKFFSMGSRGNRGIAGQPNRDAS